MASTARLLEERSKLVSERNWKPLSAHKARLLHAITAELDKRHANAPRDHDRM